MEGEIIIYFTPNKYLFCSFFTQYSSNSLSLIKGNKIIFMSIQSCLKLSPNWRDNVERRNR